MKKRFLRAAAGLLVCILLIGSCALADGEDVQGNAIVLPEPEAIETNMILGEQVQPISRDVRLYVPSGFSLTNAVQTFEAEDASGLIQCVFSALCAAAEDPAVSEIALNGFEFSRGILTLDLSLDTLNLQDEGNRLAFLAAIVNTYLGIDGIDAVNVLIGGCGQSLAHLPLGTFTAPFESLSAAYARLQSEYDRVFETGAEAVTRSCVIYFPSEDGQYLLPEVHEIRLSDESSIRAVLTEICVGAFASDLASPLTEDLEMLAEDPILTADESGRRIAEINLSEMVANYLALSGSDIRRLYGSIVLSLCSFVPELDAVRICLAGEPIDECIVGTEVLTFADGILRRSDFTRFIGGSADMYFCDGEGKAVRRRCALSRRSALSPLCVLSKMLDGDCVPQEDLYTVFPEGVSSADLLGISVSEGTALVNLSGNFYAACQSVTEDRERVIVYAIVNTLCAADNISAVQLLIEGRSVETLAHSICLSVPLLPDPGFGVSPSADGQDAS